MEKVSGRAQKAEGQAERGRDDSAIGQRLKVVCVPTSRSRSSYSTTGQISTGNGVTDRDGVGGDGAVRCCRASQRSAPPCSAICRPFPRAPGRLLLSSWARATSGRKVLSDWMVHGSPAALVSAGVPSCEQQLAWHTCGRSGAGRPGHRSVQSQNHTHLHTHTGTEHRETPRRSHPDRDAHKQASQTDHTAAHHLTQHQSSKHPHQPPRSPPDTPITRQREPVRRPPA